MMDDKIHFIFRIRKPSKFTSSFFLKKILRFDLSVVIRFSKNDISYNLYI